jgi:hypothetical protein
MRRLLTGGRSGVSGVLVAALVMGMLAPWLHADDGHDLDGGPALVIHDASQHRLTADAGVTDAPLADQHCLACHFSRLVRDPVHVTPAGPPDLACAGIRADYSGYALLSVAGPPLPARAPPASTLA